jgi:hypothetical protein
VGPVSNPAEGSASVRAFPAVADRWRKSRQCREDVVEAGLVLAVCDWGFCVYRQEHSVCLVPTASASNRLRQALGALTSGVSARTHHGQCAVSVGAGVQELLLSLSSRRARVPSRAATAAHSLIAPSQISVTTPDRTRHLEGAGTQARSANDSPRRSLVFCCLYPRARALSSPGCLWPQSSYDSTWVPPTPPPSIRKVFLVPGELILLGQLFGHDA